MSSILSISTGSQWRRWDPHIHTPDTLLNDQFDDWESYLQKLENSAPQVEALGITDTLCRLSIGVEAVEDLRADLTQALR